MGSSLLQQIEQVAKTQSTIYLKNLLRQYGIPLKLFKQVKTTHSSVYGKTAGETVQNEDEIMGIVVGDDFFPSDSISFGTFEEGFLYTSSTIPQVGDTVQIERPGNQMRKFKIMEKQSLGTTNNVFDRFKLAALG